MADLEFFFDPMCPFAWITSRWVTEVQQLRNYDVTWRFISLKMINEHRIGTDPQYDAPYAAGHLAGLQIHRVIDEVRQKFGNAEVAQMYTLCGEAIHVDRRRKELVADPEAFMVAMLDAAGLPTDLAAHVHDESHDAFVRTETDAAFARTGPDVGTPILTFRPGQPDEGSFFGPVISKSPRGDDALRLWDAVETLATTCSMAELKRSNRDPLDFT
jgi:2-hydroxychromene-2-carboxylate isomerase